MTIVGKPFAGLQRYYTIHVFASKACKLKIDQQEINYFAATIYFWN